MSSGELPSTATGRGGSFLKGVQFDSSGWADLSHQIEPFWTHGCGDHHMTMEKQHCYPTPLCMIYCSRFEEICSRIAQNSSVTTRTKRYLDRPTTRTGDFVACMGNDTIIHVNQSITCSTNLMQKALVTVAVTIQFDNL